MNKKPLIIKSISLLLAVLLLSASLAGCADLTGAVKRIITNGAAETETPQSLPEQDNDGEDLPAPKRKVDSDCMTMYDIDVFLNDGERTLECEQRVTYVNQEHTGLEEVWFHLYPNAFLTSDSAPFSKDEWEYAYPNGFSKGGIEIEKVLVDGIKVDFAIDGKEQTALRVPLGKQLGKDGSVNIDFTYTVTLPNSYGRFGYGAHTINACNWYPIACIYDGEKWHTEPYYSIGDPFYSEVACYNVTIDVPTGYVVAPTGEVETHENENGRTVYTAWCDLVRDFAFFASMGFKTRSATIDGVEVTSYYWSEDAGRRALDYAAESLGIFSDKFGKYPYKTYRVVQSDFYIGGMEYPTIVQIDSSLYTHTVFLEYVVAHETAHQWWYQLVGNDEVNEPWLDEALTEYSTVVYYGERYGGDAMQSMLSQQGLEKYSRRISQGYVGSDESIERPVYKFNDNVEYDSLVYAKGMLMFAALNEEMGDREFFKAIKRYFSENIHSNATKSDLIDAIDHVSDEDYAQWIERWLTGDIGQQEVTAFWSDK